MEETYNSGGRNMISLFRHHIYPESMNNVQEVLKSGWTGLGPKTEEFERKFTEYIGGNKYAVAVNSGTSALQLAMEVSGIQPGHWVVSTPMTFVATNHVIHQYGAYPAFADITVDGNIDIFHLEEFIIKLRKEGYNVRGLMVVHYGGNPINLMKLYDIAEELDLVVIEDCAHACGAAYNGVSTEFAQVKIGGYKKTAFAAFSFHSVKNLAVGDGGMLMLASADLYEKAKKLRWFGIDKSTASRTNNRGYSWDYNVNMFGHKWHMNDISAAIGLGQLLHLDTGNIYRQTLVDLYHSYLGEIEEVFLPIDKSAYRTSSNHLIPMLVPDALTKVELMQFLSLRGIQTGVHYKPNHMYSIYKGSITQNKCETAMQFYQREISLPLHVELTTEDVWHVCESIKEFFEVGKK
jgi:perosamine synthetase